MLKKIKQHTLKFKFYYSPHNVNTILIKFLEVNLIVNFYYTYIYIYYNEE